MLLRDLVLEDTVTRHLAGDHGRTIAVARAGVTRGRGVAEAGVARRDDGHVARRLSVAAQAEAHGLQLRHFVSKLPEARRGAQCVSSCRPAPLTCERS